MSTSNGKNSTVFESEIKQLKQIEGDLINRLSRVQSQIKVYLEYGNRIGTLIENCKSLIEEDNRITAVLQDALINQLPELRLAAKEAYKPSEELPSELPPAPIPASELPPVPIPAPAPPISDVIKPSVDLEPGTICQIISEPINPPTQQHNKVGHIGTITGKSQSFHQTPYILRFQSDEANPSTGYYSKDNLKVISTKPESIKPEPEPEVEVEPKVDTEALLDVDGNLINLKGESISFDDISLTSLTVPFQTKTKVSGASSWAEFLLSNHDISTEIRSIKDAPIEYPYDSKIRYVLIISAKGNIPEAVINYDYRMLPVTFTEETKTESDNFEIGDRIKVIQTAGGLENKEGTVIGIEPSDEDNNTLINVDLEFNTGNRVIPVVTTFESHEIVKIDDF